MRFEFFFDFPSPYSYLAWTQLRKLKVEAEAVPVDILTVMKTVSNQPSTVCPPKMRYAMLDAGRWAALYDVPLRFNEPLFAAWKEGRFAWSVLTSGTLAAKDAGIMADYIDAIYRAVWAAPADLVSEEGRRAVLRDAGIAAPDLWERAATAEIVARLDANNRKAAERGVFGVPTFFAGDEPFFGNDRLDMALARLPRMGLRQGGQRS
jgi:2-hydroxychromene-2-carboxylate isomerase